MQNKKLNRLEQLKELPVSDRIKKSIADKIKQVGKVIYKDNEQDIQQGTK